MDENAIHYCIAVQYCHIMYVRTHAHTKYVHTYIHRVYVRMCSMALQCVHYQCLATERKYCTVVPS